MKIEIEDKNSEIKYIKACNDQMKATYELQLENIKDDGTGTSSIRPFGIYNLDDCLAHPENEYTVHRLKIIPKAGATSTDIFSVEVTCSMSNWGGDPRLAYTVMNYENLQDTDLDTTQEFVLQTNKFNSFEFISESDYG